MTRLRFLPRQPENQEVELLVLALLGLTGNAEVLRRAKVCVCVCACVCVYVSTVACCFS